MSPTFRALAHRNYRLYYTGGFISNIGTWMQRVAQDWLVLLLSDNSGTALGITTGLQFLPILLLSPYAGAVADRFPKKRLLQLAQVMMAAPAVLLGVLAVTGVAEQWHVYAIALLFGIGTAFEAPGAAVVRQRAGHTRGPAERGQPQLGVVQRRPHHRPRPGRPDDRRAAAPGVAGDRCRSSCINAASYGAVLVALQAIRGGLPERGRSAAAAPRDDRRRDALRPQPARTCCWSSA